MDPIGNMLTQIKNAGAVGKASVCLPYSNHKMLVLEKMSQSGFVGKVEKKGKIKPKIEVEVLYKEDSKDPLINDSSRVSKLSRRIYKGYRDIRPIKRGHGLLIVSTPKGVMTGEEARKEKVGGELICSIW